MTTITRMTTAIEVDAAHALWMTLHDSAFPAGRLVHSNGVESWLRAHPEASAARVAELVRDYVAEAVAGLDAVIAAHAWEVRDIRGLTELDELLLTYKTSVNARDASLIPGRGLTETCRRIGLSVDTTGYLDAVLGCDVPGNLAVVEAVIQSALGIDRGMSVLGTLRSALSAVLSACVRLGRIGSRAAQRVLIDATPELIEHTQIALTTPLTSLANNMFELEMTGMNHTRYSPRLFAT